MEFIELANKRYMIKGSNNFIVSEEEKLKLQKKQLIIEDIASNECQSKTTQKIKKIDEELKNAKPKSKYKAFKETEPITE